MYKYWNVLPDDDSRSTTELLVAALAVLQSRDVELSDKARVLKGFPTPLWAKSEDVSYYDKYCLS